MIYETYIIVSGTQSRINVTLLSYILSYDPFKMPTPTYLFDKKLHMGKIQHKCTKVPSLEKKGHHIGNYSKKICSNSLMESRLRNLFNLVTQPLT